jgi:hypothetical protein
MNHKMVDVKTAKAGGVALQSIHRNDVTGSDDTSEVSHPGGGGGGMGHRLKTTRYL